MTEFTAKHGNALRFEGILVLILGALAILLPSVATLGIGLLINLIFTGAWLLAMSSGLKRVAIGD